MRSKLPYELFPCILTYPDLIVRAEPEQEIVTEFLGTYEGFIVQVNLVRPTGHRTGYVLWGVGSTYDFWISRAISSFSDFVESIDTHGGITYSCEDENMSERFESIFSGVELKASPAYSFTPNLKNSWLNSYNCIGIDYAHYHDACDSNAVADYWGEDSITEFQRRYFEMKNGRDGQLATTNTVLQELCLIIQAYLLPLVAGKVPEPYPPFGGVVLDAVCGDITHERQLAHLQNIYKDMLASNTKKIRSARYRKLQIDN